MTSDEEELETFENSLGGRRKYSLETESHVSKHASHSGGLMLSRMFGGGKSARGGSDIIGGEGSSGNIERDVYGTVLFTKFKNTAAAIARSPGVLPLRIKDILKCVV